MWVETRSSDQSPFQKLNLFNSCQKFAKLDNLFLKSCPILLYSLLCAKYFVQDCLSQQIFGQNLTALCNCKISTAVINSKTEIPYDAIA